MLSWTTQGMYLWADSFFAKSLRSVTDGLIETLQKPKINRRYSPIKQWFCKAAHWLPCGASIAPFCRVTCLYCTFLKPVVLKLSVASESPGAKQNTACQAPPTTSSWFSLSGRRRPRMCVFMSSWMTSLLLFPGPHLAMPWNFSRARHLLERQLLSNPAHTMSKLQWDQGQRRSPPSCLALSTLCPRRGQQQGLWMVGVEQAPGELAGSFLTASRPRRGVREHRPSSALFLHKSRCSSQRPWEDRLGWGRIRCPWVSCPMTKLMSSCWQPTLTPDTHLQTPAPSWHRSHLDIWRIDLLCPVYTDALFSSSLHPRPSELYTGSTH